MGPPEARAALAHIADRLRAGAPVGPAQREAMSDLIAAMSTVTATSGDIERACRRLNDTWTDLDDFRNTIEHGGGTA